MEETETATVNRDKIDAIVNDYVRYPQPSLSPSEKNYYYTLINAKLKQHKATIIAHYYTPPDVQELAEQTGGFVGDSLEMARFGSRCNSDYLIICGVRFMGETAKILSPCKQVKVAAFDATCSLDLGCPAAEFRDFCKRHDDRTVVVYANTSAEVKAIADWVVTSSIALDVVEYLHDKGEKILWAPDRHLGNYIRKRTGANMVMWRGSCIVHEEFKADLLIETKLMHPNAAVLVHPEAPDAVVKQADVVGSTSQLIAAAHSLPNQQLIVATDAGIFYKMQEQVPNKELIIAPTGGNSATCKSCARCPWMQLNNLEAIANCFDDDANEITIPTAVAIEALKSLEKMVHFNKYLKT